MKSNRMLLLGTLLRSTSSLNTIKNTNAKDKKKKAIGALTGQIVIFVMLVAYCGLMAYGLGYNGTYGVLPSMAAGIICLMSFMLTLFKTNGYLFAFKEYDMLMAMPFSVRTIVADKFLYMYLNSLMWSASISVASLAVYAYFARPAFYVYILWIVISMTLPIIPMVAASAIGALITGMSAGFKYKKIVQTALIFVIIIPLFFMRFIIEKIVRDGSLSAIMEKAAVMIESGTDWYLPIRWFGEAVSGTGYLGALATVVLSVIVFELFVVVVSKYYRSINSKLMTSSHSTHKKEAKYKARNMVVSVAYKEFKRLLGSTAYATNVGIGFIMSVVFGIIAIFADGQAIVSAVTQGAPVEASVVTPAISMLIYFFTGMIATTACSPSLEGKNYWIIKTLPVDNKTIMKGKGLFNILFFGPVAVFATLMLSISFKADVLTICLNVVLMIILTLFSTLWGLFCGYKFIKLEWDNEIEVIKQGTAIVVYMFPNMFLSMILLSGSVALGIFMGTIPAILILIAIYSVLTLGAYALVSGLAKKMA